MSISEEAASEAVKVIYKFEYKRFSETETCS